MSKHSRRTGTNRDLALAWPATPKSQLRGYAPSSEAVHANRRIIDPLTVPVAEQDPAKKEMPTESRQPEVAPIGNSVVKRQEAGQDGQRNRSHPCSTSEIRLQGLTWFVRRRAGTR